MDKNRIILSSDHAGFELKEKLSTLLREAGFDVVDVGTHSTASVDYPLFAGKVAKAVAQGEFYRGITICGTGIGSSIAANRVKGVRAALCITEEMAKFSRSHNNANVLVLGSRITSYETVQSIVNVWLGTEFDGGRHEARIQQLDQ